MPAHHKPCGLTVRTVWGPAAVYYTPAVYTPAVYTPATGNAVWIAKAVGINCYDRMGPCCCVLHQRPGKQAQRIGRYGASLPCPSRKDLGEARVTFSSTGRIKWGLAAVYFTTRQGTQVTLDTYRGADAHTDVVRCAEVHGQVVTDHACVYITGTHAHNRSVPMRQVCDGGVEVARGRVAPHCPRLGHPACGYGQYFSRKFGLQCGRRFGGPASKKSPKKTPYLTPHKCRPTLPHCPLDVYLSYLQACSTRCSHCLRQQSWCRWAACRLPT